MPALLAIQPSHVSASQVSVSGPAPKSKWTAPKEQHGRMSPGLCIHMHAQTHIHTYDIHKTVIVGYFWARNLWVSQASAWVYLKLVTRRLEGHVSHCCD